MTSEAYERVAEVLATSSTWSNLAGTPRPPIGGAWRSVTGICLLTMRMAGVEIVYDLTSQWSVSMLTVSQGIIAVKFLPGVN